MRGLPIHYFIWAGIISLFIYLSYPVIEFIYIDSFGINTYYKTYADAVKDRGPSWIPSFVPEDAYDLHDWRLPSPEDYYLTFKYISSEKFQKLIQDYEGMEMNPLTDTGIGWPKFKEISIDALKNIPASVDITTAKCYRLPILYGTACLIDDQKHKTAYFYWDYIKEECSSIQPQVNIDFL